MSRNRRSKPDKVHRPSEVLPVVHHETLALSERDRAALFDALVHAPDPSPRLRRAFVAERKCIGSG